MELGKGTKWVLALTGGFLLLEGAWALAGQDEGDYRVIPERGRRWSGQVQETIRPVIWLESTPTPEPTPSQSTIHIYLPGETPPPAESREPKIKIILPGEETP